MAWLLLLFVMTMVLRAISMVSIMVACCVGVVAGVDVDAGERCVARHTNDENGGKIDAMLPSYQRLSPKVGQCSSVCMVNRHDIHSTQY